MKRLVLVGGPMGVGKSTVCTALLERLQPGVYLDGDWCWHMRPFTVNAETKAMVLDNICALLARFLACGVLENVIFGWVMHQQEIWDEICRRLPLRDVEVYRFALLASPEVLRQRVERDMAAGRRETGAVERSLAYLPLYGGVEARKLCTDGLTPGEAAECLVEWIKEGENRHGEA